MGHREGKPGRPGNSLISAHRDTHIRFLRDLQPVHVIQRALSLGGNKGKGDRWLRRSRLSDSQVLLSPFHMDADMVWSDMNLCIRDMYAYAQPEKAQTDEADYRYG